MNTNSPFLKSIMETMRARYYAKKTITAYVYWIHFFIVFNGKKHPIDCHNEEVEGFLSFLANVRNVAPKTQGLALNALVYLYKEILGNPLTLDLRYNKTKAQPRLPVVLTIEETALLLKNIPASVALPCSLLYGSGLRLMESLRLRVQDIDFDYLSLHIWHAKGGKHRRVTLAKELVGPLKQQIEMVKLFYTQDMRNNNYRGVYLPYALETKYPNAAKDLA